MEVTISNLCLIDNDIYMNETKIVYRVNNWLLIFDNEIKELSFYSLGVHNDKELSKLILAIMSTRDKYIQECSVAAVAVSSSISQDKEIDDGSCVQLQQSCNERHSKKKKQMTLYILDKCVNNSNLQDVSNISKTRVALLNNKNGYFDVKIKLNSIYREEQCFVIKMSNDSQVIERKLHKDFLQLLLNEIYYTNILLEKIIVYKKNKKNEDKQINVYLDILSEDDIEFCLYYNNNIEERKKKKKTNDYRLVFKKVENSDGLLNEDTVDINYIIHVRFNIFIDHRRVQNRQDVDYIWRNKELCMIFL